MGVKVYSCYQTKCDCYKAAKPIKPIGILVHSTGANNPNLKRYVDFEEICGKNVNVNHWNRSGLTTQVHAFLGKDKDGNIAVINTLPYNIACWGCGRGKNGSYNYNPTACIQFEICEQQGDKAYFDAAFKAAAEYCAILCKEFGWTEKDIVSHCEAAKLGYASNHGDPDHWLKLYGKDMDWFRAEVKKCLTANGEQMYRVGRYWANGKCAGQIGAYRILQNAITACPTGYRVYDKDGRIVFRHMKQENRR